MGTLSTCKETFLCDKTRDTSILPSSPNSSVLMREGSSKVAADPLPTSAFSRVLQGQESSILRGAFAESNESDSSDKPIVWPTSVDDDKIDVISASQRYGSEKWLPSGRTEASFTNLLSGFGTQSNSSNEFYTPGGQNTVTASTMRTQLPDQEGKFSLLPSLWSVMPSNLSLNLLDSSVKDHVQGSDIPYHHARGDVRFGGFREYQQGK